MDKDLVFDDFKVKTCDGVILEIPNNIIKISSFFKVLYEDKPNNSENVYDISHIKIKSEVFKFILKHL